MPKRRRTRRNSAALSALLLTTACAVAPPESCVPEGAWVAPSGLVRLDRERLLDEMAAERFVLLGERHDAAAHHRWQAAVIEKLHERRPGLVIGLEMLPRRAQPALDRFVAGAVDEAGFVEESGWRRVWGMDFALYRPVFEVARRLRIPMVALNVDRGLVAKVARLGFEATTPEEREGIGRPAPPTEGYRERLAATFAGHSHGSAAGLDGFVAGQLVWDKAMADALVAASAGGGPVVALVGAGHAEHFDGVPHQVAALGERRPAVLLPWEPGRPCDELTADLASAVFGLDQAGVRLTSR